MTTADLGAPPTGDGNNTAAFVCRRARTQTRWSAHAYGLAVDLNPFQNPYHLRPTPIRLRPFYEPREQARRDRAEDRTARRAMRAERRLGRKTERAFKHIQRRQDREQGRAAAARVVWPDRDGGRR